MTEREKAQKKQAVDKAAATAVTTQPSEAGQRPSSTVPDTTTLAQPTREDDPAQAPREVSSMPPTVDHSKSSLEEERLPTEAQKDVPQQSIEVSIHVCLAFGHANRR